MSGTYAAVLPLFDPTPIPPAETTRPTIDDTIFYLRWQHPYMIETLDDRMKHQRELVLEILMRKRMTARELFKLTNDEADALDDPELRLCYHVLKDIAYLDSLR